MTSAPVDRTWAREAGRILREQAGIDPVAITPVTSGESGAAFWIRDRAGADMLLKVMRDREASALDYLGRVDAVTARLRARGYPAPLHLFAGLAAGVAFWVQERLPGTPVGDRPGHALAIRLLPEMIRLNDAQAGLGDGQPGWPELITRTLTDGGDGYCLHSTLEDRPDTRDMLRVIRGIGESCAPDISAAGDFVHFDFTLANLLSDGSGITGVIDISPPVLSGDRAFDLATLLFYGYDADDLRVPLRARVADLAGPRASRAYLAHMVLRQVDWSLRHHPAAAATGRHLRLARLVMADLAGGALS